MAPLVEQVQSVEPLLFRRRHARPIVVAVGADDLDPVRIEGHILAYREEAHRAARGGSSPRRGAVAVDTSGLKPLGKDWVSEDPYRGDTRAVEVGMDGYNQNCARCHGLEVKSGGFVPDLRYLPTGADGDALFLMRMRNGAQKDGRIMMPKFDGVLPQELLWAIRTFLESKHLDN